MFDLFKLRRRGSGYAKILVDTCLANADDARRAAESVGPGQYELRVHYGHRRRLHGRFRVESMCWS